MKSLETVQKTFSVFQVLAKVAYILCIVGAILFGIGSLCAVTQYNGGQIFIVNGESVKIFPDGTDLLQKYVELLSIALMLVADAILFGLSKAYLKSEQADGTPFTENGANRIRLLGVRFIYIPIIAIAISETIAAIQGVKMVLEVSNLSCVVTGVILILLSLVFRYGAELEEKNKSDKQSEE